MSNAEWHSRPREQNDYLACQNPMWHSWLMIPTLPIDSVNKTHWGGCGWLFNWPMFVCSESLNYQPLFQVSWTHTRVAGLKKRCLFKSDTGLFVCFQMLQFYKLLLLPLSHPMSNILINRSKWFGVSEKHLSSPSNFSTEVCVKAPLTRCSGNVFAGGGELTSSCQQWSPWTWLLSAIAPWRAFGRTGSSPRSHHRVQPGKQKAT